MLAVLADLVACDTLRGTFPRGVPRRGCVRRQLEQKRDGTDWTPAHSACAACELGRGVRSEVEAAGVDLGTCKKHGAAMVGEPCEACEADRIAKGKPCPECGGIERHAPEGCSRKGRSNVGDGSGASYRGPVSTLIWTGEVPDVPIGAPPKPVTARAAAPQPTEDERGNAAMLAGSQDRSPPALDPVDLDAVAGALRGLGFKPPDVARLAHACKGETLQDRVKDALRLVREGAPVPPAPRAVVGIPGGHAGLEGGTKASATRLAAPRQTTAWTAVMTETLCRCGCGRQLRKNNTSGFSGYCNPARYAAGERPPRKSRAKEAQMPCGNCGKQGHNARSCSEKKPETKTSAPPPQGGRKGKVVALRRPRAAGKPGDVDVLLARREGLVKTLRQTEAAIEQVDSDLRAALAREEERIEQLRAAVQASAQRAAGAE